MPVPADYAYEDLGRVTSIDAGANLAKFDYTYWNNENNIRRKIFDHRSGDPYNEYSYDDIDRVTGITYLDSDTESFVMDDLGNRVGNQALRDDGTVNFAVDTETNRYTAIDSASLDYDEAGNLTRDKDGYVYSYDYENRIVKIIDDEETLIAEFDYDTQGRRIRTISYDSVPSVATLYYYSDNWQVMVEYDNSNYLKAYYVYGNYIDEALLMHRNSADKFYLHDHLYSPVALLSSAGAAIERYEYDAYGKAQILTSDFSLLTSSAYDNHILFTGREVDRFDNGNLPLQYNRNRYLSQYMGCWFSHDPLGYVDGINQFQYTHNNPIGHLDPLGLNAIGEAIKKCPSLKTLKAAKKLVEAIAEIAPSLTDYPGGGNGHPWEHCMWSCRMASRYGKEYAKKMGDKKEELDMAYKAFADTLSNTCWDELSESTKRELSAWVCSAKQAADEKDNETGRDCSSDCDTCQDCCTKNGVPPKTAEGNSKRPYGPYCQGRYKDTLGNPVVEAPLFVSFFQNY